MLFKFATFINAIMIRGSAPPASATAPPDPARRVLCIAIASRATYLAIIGALGALLPDYDTSARLLSASCADDWPQKVAAAVPSPRRLPLVVWDAVFFHRIAHCGYEYEQFHAFFPAYPGALAWLTSLAPRGPYAFVAAGLVLNTVAFLASSFFVLRISHAVLRDARMAAAAALLFMFNPASVFHASLYTEGVYGCATFAGVYLLVCRRAPLAAAAAFALATGVRSNGILNAGLLLHAGGREVVAAAAAAWRSGNARGKAGASVRTAAAAAARAVLGSALVLAPYALFQYTGFLRYCHPLGVGGEAAPPPRPWCAARVPNLYGYVQDAYWGVGLFKYYSASQVPNFLLAAPTLGLTLWGCVSYAARNPLAFWTGGLMPQPSREPASQKGIPGISYTPLRWQQQQAQLRRSRSSTPESPRLDAAAATAAKQRAGGGGDAPGAALRRRAALNAARAGAAAGGAPGSGGGGGDASPATRSRSSTPERSLRAAPASPHGASAAPSAAGDASGFYHADVAAFVWQWAFMAAFAALVMHVQVATRFLSSCLPWYWWGAHLLLHRPRAAAWLWGYCLVFMALGAALFPSFLPWT